MFSSKDLLNSLVVERMLAGVATRRHQDVAEPVGEDIESRSKSLSKSAISRRFVAATKTAMAELMARSLVDLDVAVLMIDGLDVAGQCVVVALVITTDGTKVPVGLWLGDTENKTVVTAPLGRPGRPGAVAPRVACCASSTAPRPSPPASSKVFGDEAVVQRCTLHKRQEFDWSSAQGAGSDHRPAPGDDLRPARCGEGTGGRPSVWPKSSRPTTPTPPPPCARDWTTCSPFGASGSGGALAKTLTNTNCIESMISIARRTTRRVTRWKDGSMKKRWIAAGMLEAERSFRRVRGHKDMAKLIDALRREVTPVAVTPEEYDQAAA